MQESMISGMLEALDDPYTVYVPYEETDDFNKELRGEYVGIGAEVNIIDDYLTIVSPMDGSPALKAGVMAGDVVLEIGGESTFGLSIEECIDRLMGEPSTNVTIRVRHLDGTEEDLVVTRQRIVTQTVKGLRRFGEEWDYCIDAELGLFYVRVTQFNASTIRELRDVLDELQTNGLNGVVLDLRDNPGGALPSAVAMADMFLESGDVVTVRSRDGEDRTFSATPNGTLPEFPMIVIVNSASASASEIVAGALQDNGRAIVLGTRTFGKGSVQEVRKLPFNRGTLKFTSAHYFRPSGRNIHRLPDSAVWGVDPDPGFVVAITDEAYIDMFRARRDFEIIRETDGEEPPCADAAWIRDKLLDEQLATAVEALRTRVRGNDWPAAGEDDSTLVAFGQELNRAMERRMRLLERLDELEIRIGELQHLASDAGRTPLLPEDVELTSGTITLRDKYGNLIGTFRIEGGNVELALESLDLEPLADEVVRE
jgi:carboxyl-terminal processing protease